MTHVLHVTDNYPPAGGGLERAVSTMATAWQAAGHQAEVATLSRADAPAEEVLDGIPVHRLDGYVRHLRRFAADPGHQYHPTFRDPRLTRRLQELVDSTQPDIVHAHGWILYSALRLRLPPGTALVLSLHDFSLVCANKTLLRKGRVCDGPDPLKCLSCSLTSYGPVRGVPLAAGLLLHTKASPKIDKVIANSRYVARISATAAGIDPDSVGVVPVSGELGSTDEAVDRPRFLPEGRFILFVGAMGPHKGLDLLLDAHQALSQPLPLVVLGYPRADSPDCDRPGVTVVTDVPHHQVLASMSAATVGVVPSVCAEAFGLVAVEGMSRGTPMIVSAVGGLQEVVENELSGLIVPPGDRRALTSALERLVADESLAARLGNGARLRAQDYTMTAALPRLSAYYAEALSSAAARRPSSSSSPR